MAAMRTAPSTLLYFAALVFLSLVRSARCQFEWQLRDSFDEIRLRLDSVNADNCHVLDLNQLFLPASTVTHLPDLKNLGIDPIYPNRTNLLQVHNFALTRAFYYSYILQKAGDDAEPGFMYYFLSGAADVAANRVINASAIYYGPNMAFTPSYKGFFNKTLPLFAPRAYRADDFNDPYHLMGTSTLNTIETADLGAIPNNTDSANYTTEFYKINEWYKGWLPDLTTRHDSKTTYTVQITHSNGTNETFVWHGPPAASDEPGPVKWTRPYFDCGRSNKWIFGATVPVPDIFPRHTGWRHIEIPVYVAAVVMELDFEMIDINQCPTGEGNPAPNYFGGTARCKNMTTQCEPIHGFGFRRGGYQCRCRAGYRLPNVVRTPYSGELVERASQANFHTGFDCDRIGYIAVRTQTVERLSQHERRQLIDKLETLTGLGTELTVNQSSEFDVYSTNYLGGHTHASQSQSQQQSYPFIPPSYTTHNLNYRLDPNRVANFTRRGVTRRNCEMIGRHYPELLTLRGDVAFGKEEQFDNQARMAVRLAHFISSFLQIVDPRELFAEFRVPDKQLTTDQLIGEVLAAVAGDRKIQGLGILWERNAFPNRTLFAPYAYRLDRNTRRFHVDDLARFVLPGLGQNNRWNYLRQEYFTHLRSRWAASTDALQTYTTKIHTRYNSSGIYSIRYDHYPVQYRAAEVGDGFWGSPYFDCGGFHGAWLINYGVPFFGPDSIRSRLLFKGVVMVTVKLEDMDINQCNDEYHVPNAFKDTHKCDRRSARCVPLEGRGFEAGGYKCECAQGFEYPYNDPFTFFDGQILEAEYENMYQDRPSRFDTLKCRIAAATPRASHLVSGWGIGGGSGVGLILLFALLFSLLSNAIMTTN